MPFITTLFFVELTSNQRLRIAAHADERGSDSAAPGLTGEAPSSALNRNSFTAAIMTIAFLEEKQMDLPETGDAHTASAEHKRARVGDKKTFISPDSGERIRVSLVALLRRKNTTAAGDRGGEQSQSRREDADARLASKEIRTAGDETITLASYIFDASAGKQHKRAAHERDAEGSEEPHDAPTAPSFQIVLKSPLVLSSDSEVDSLSVYVHIIMRRDTPDGKTRTALKPYSGPRRFVVRMTGQQLTELTKKQVVLMSQS